MEVMANFTERLRQLRDESGKTQSQIAKELGLTPQAFSYFVNGREPNYETLGKIADYFQVSVDYLLGRSEVKTADPTLEAACKYTGLSEKAVENLHFDAKLKGQGKNAVWGELIDAIVTSGPQYLALTFQTYKEAIQRVYTFGEKKEQASMENLSLPENQRKIEVLSEFHKEFRQDGRVVFGDDYVRFLSQEMLSAFQMMLPRMAGIPNEKLGEYIAKAEKNREMWANLSAESRKLSEEKDQEAPNGEKPAGQPQTVPDTEKDSGEK